MVDRVGAALWYWAILSPLISLLLFWRLKGELWFSRILFSLAPGLRFGTLRFDLYWLSNSPLIVLVHPAKQKDAEKHTLQF